MLFHLLTVLILCEDPISPCKKVISRSAYSYLSSVSVTSASSHEVCSVSVLKAAKHNNFCYQIACNFLNYFFKWLFGLYNARKCSLSQHFCFGDVNGAVAASCLFHNPSNKSKVGSFCCHLLFCIFLVRG